MTNITYRMATAADTDLILEFIKELAEYEKLLHEVVATPDDIRESLFGENPKAFCALAEMDGAPVGFCLSYYTYSTFLGKAGIYLEDLYVKEEARGHGVGKGFFNFLAQKAIDEDCGRIEWSVLDWNEPSIEFYKNLGAEPLDEWIKMRLEGDTINNVLEKTEPKAA